jgi:hypothetical protein
MKSTQVEALARAMVRARANGNNLPCKVTNNKRGGGGGGGGGGK